MRHLRWARCSSYSAKQDKHPILHILQPTRYRGKKQVSQTKKGAQTTFPHDLPNITPQQNLYSPITAAQKEGTLPDNGRKWGHGRFPPNKNFVVHKAN